MGAKCKAVIPRGHRTGTEGARQLRYQIGGNGTEAQVGGGEGSARRQRSPAQGTHSGSGVKDGPKQGPESEKFHNARSKGNRQSLQREKHMGHGKATGSEGSVRLIAA